MDRTLSPFHHLHDTQCASLRLVHTPTLTKLQRFTLSESVQIELDTDELTAFLRGRPRKLLWDALGLPTAQDVSAVADELTRQEANPFFGLDEPPLPLIHRVTDCPCARCFTIRDAHRRGAKALGLESDTLPGQQGC